jgi:hypothetical protein
MLRTPPDIALAIESGLLQVVVTIAGSIKDDADSKHAIIRGCSIRCYSHPLCITPWSHSYRNVSPKLPPSQPDLPMESHHL